MSTDLSEVELVFESSETLEAFSTFDELGLKEELLSGIRAYGFERPSTMQQRVISPVVSGRDVIAQGHSCTGRTTTLAISVLQRIDTTTRETQALILSPTRELAKHVQSIVTALGGSMNVQCHACVGGTPIREDIRILNEGVHVISGTPGRAFDMIRRRNLRTKNIKMLVLEDAGELLDRGFQSQIYDIYRYLPPATQVALITTTLPNDLVEMTNKFMANPLKIHVKYPSYYEGIKQFFIVVEEDGKFDKLRDSNSTISTQAIIFCKSRRKVESLAEKMRGANFSVSGMHGDTPQEEFDRIKQEFLCGSTRFLTTTDGKARGLDVSLMFNYDFPSNSETYTNRIARSGCFSRKGVVVSFVTATEIKTLRDIEQIYNIKIDEMPVDVTGLL